MDDPHSKLTKVKDDRYTLAYMSTCDISVGLFDGERQSSNPIFSSVHHIMMQIVDLQQWEITGSGLIKNLNSISV